MMKSPEQFVDKLKGFKEVVDSNLVPATNVAAVKTLYMSSESFTP